MPTEAAAAVEPDHPLLLSFPTRLSRIGQGKRLVIDAAPKPGMPGRPEADQAAASRTPSQGEAPCESGHSHRRSGDSGKAQPILCGAVAPLDLSRARYHPGDPGRPATR